MKTDLTINATSASDGKKVTNKITYVNPDITNSQAITLAQAICSLTTDSYTKTTRTDTTDCDASKIARVFSNIRITSLSASQQEAVTVDPSNVYTVNYPISKLSDAMPQLTFWFKSTSFATMSVIPKIETTIPIEDVDWRGPDYTTGGYNNAWTVKIRPTFTTQTFGFKITFPDDKNYGEVTLDFTINIVQE